MESLERKEEAGEGMNEFVVKYIILYNNNMITKATLWLKRQTNSCRLFLGDLLGSSLFLSHSFRFLVVIL